MQEIDGEVLTMDDLPSLVTERLILRPLAPEDATSIWQMAGDRDIAAQSTRIPHPYEKEDAVLWIESQKEECLKGTQLNFAITDRSNGTLLGIIGLLHINRDNETAEMGYWVGKTYWNRGYATEAVKAVLNYSFRILGLNRIYSHYMKKNPASGRVLAKCGFLHEGSLRQHVKKWGIFEDIEVCAILEAEFRYDTQ